eukprot:403354938
MSETEEYQMSQGLEEYVLSLNDSKLKLAQLFDNAISIEIKEDFLPEIQNEDHKIWISSVIVNSCTMLESLIKSNLIENYLEMREQLSDYQDLNDEVQRLQTKNEELQVKIGHSSKHSRSTSHKCSEEQYDVISQNLSSYRGARRNHTFKGQRQNHVHRQSMLINSNTIEFFAEVEEAKDIVTKQEDQISDLLSKITQLEAQLRTLENESRLKESLKIKQEQNHEEIEQQIQILFEKLTDQRKDYAILETQLSEQIKLLNIEKSNNQKLEDKIVQQLIEFNELNSKYQHIQSENKQTKDRLHKLQEYSHGFSVEKIRMKNEISQFKNKMIDLEHHLANLNSKNIQILATPTPENVAKLSNKDKVQPLLFTRQVSHFKILDFSASSSECNNSQLKQKSSSQNQLVEEQLKYKFNIENNANHNLQVEIQRKRSISQHDIAINDLVMDKNDKNKSNSIKRLNKDQRFDYSKTYDNNIPVYAETSQIISKQREVFIQTRKLEMYDASTQVSEDISDQIITQSTQDDIVNSRLYTKYKKPSKRLERMTNIDDVILPQELLQNQNLFASRQISQNSQRGRSIINHAINQQNQNQLNRQSKEGTLKSLAEKQTMRNGSIDYQDQYEIHKESPQKQTCKPDCSIF